MIRVVFLGFLQNSLSCFHDIYDFEIAEMTPPLDIATNQQKTIYTININNYDNDDYNDQHGWRIRK